MNYNFVADTTGLSSFV